MNKNICKKCGEKFDGQSFHQLYCPKCVKQHECDKKKVHIYISAGWFSPEQEQALEFLEKTLFNNKKFKVYSPRKEILLESGSIHSKEVRQKVFNENIEAINKADLIVSSTVGKDMGTLFENGYAYAKGIPIIYTLFIDGLEDVIFNLMLSESGIACFTDKTEFEEFISKVTKNNVSKIKKEYEGKIE